MGVTCVCDFQVCFNNFIGIVVFNTFLFSLKAYDKKFKERYALDKNADRKGRKVILNKIADVKLVFQELCCSLLLVLSLYLYTETCMEM